MLDQTQSDQISTTTIKNVPAPRAPNLFTRRHQTSRHAHATVERTEPRRYTVSAVSSCICAVSVLYLALYFSYGGASGGVVVFVLYMLFRCCFAAVLCCISCICCIGAEP
eukprot:883419-Prymnesium_polylepis.1